MLIRQLKQEEFDERIALSEFAFQYKLPEDRREEERRYFRPERVWGVFDDRGRLLSALTLLPLEIYIEGRVMRMGGLAGVASWPEARRGGNVTKLLVRALEEMREQGQTISMLHPFQFAFYRKYGWEFTIERKRYEIDMALLVKRKETAGRIERVPAEAGNLEAIYNRFASRYNGTLVRSEEWWRRRIFSKKGTAAVWRNTNGIPEGYIYYVVENRLLTVYDWACVGEESRAGLWSFIANHDSMADRIELVAPTDDSLSFLMPNPRFKQEIVPYFMSRIVDLEALASLYPFRPGDREDQLVLEVRDEYAPWNDGRFRLVFGEDGAGRVAEANRKGGSATALSGGEPDVSCDIQTLTAMLLGNRRPEWLREVGLLAGSAEAVSLLERRIPVRPSFLADFF